MEFSAKGYRIGIQGWCWYSLILIMASLGWAETCPKS
jgi:hypothetical protein